MSDLPAAASEEVLKVCHIPPIHLVPQTDKVCCQNILNQVCVGAPRDSPDQFYTCVPTFENRFTRCTSEIIQHGSICITCKDLNCSDDLARIGKGEFNMDKG